MYLAGPRREAASFAVLDAMVDAGLNFVDTADVYSAWVPGHRGGESETVIGNWFKSRGRRKDVVIATKVGMQMAADRKGLSAAHIHAPPRTRCGGCRRITLICIFRILTIRRYLSRKPWGLIKS